jgi:uncharacterized membrane protein
LAAPYNNRMSLALSITKKRVRSIDILRGLVMVIMALDHVRDFFHSQAMLQDPLNPETTTPALYFTRWITHLCAPVFVLLSGTSIYLVGLRKSKAALSAFLLKRGLWLIVVEIVVMNFAFSFEPNYFFIFLQVIWAIGISMVILSLLVWLPFPVLFGLGLVIFFGHNLLDYLEAERNGQAGFFWSLLHRQNFINISSSRTLGILYPFLPWTGIMLLGYSLGKWYEPSVDATVRRKRLLMLALALLALFLILRSINQYGDPTPRNPALSGLQAFFSFMNVQKYPPSLMFCCAVFGIGMLLLVVFERVRNKFTDVLNVYGRVPFFYYVLHFYLIHLLCIIGFFAAGYGAADIRTPNFPFNFRPPNFGYPLWAVYLIWIGVVAALYPLCKWYNKYKSTHNHWWLSYV